MWPWRESRRYSSPYRHSPGWLIWLSGVTSPIKARIRPQRFPAGLGASHVVSSSNAPPRNTQNAAPTTNTNRSRPAVYRRNQDPSSLPADATTTLPRREHSSDQDNCLDLVPEKTSHDSPSGPPCPPGVGPRSANGSQPAYAGGTYNVNIVKIPSSFTTQHRPDSSPSPHNASPHEAGRTHLLDSGVALIPTYLGPPLSLPPRPPHLPLPPVDSSASPPVNPPLIDVYYNPTLPFPPPQAPPTFTIPYITMLRGKAAFLGDDTKTPGMRGSFLKAIEPPPNPSCSVVMEILPRKFRTESFILGWLSQFPFQPRRYELVEGKAFFEFATGNDALRAWYSPRMGDLDGLLSVRLFWYRILPPQPTLENTNTPQKINGKDTIEDPSRPQLQPVSDSSTHESGHEGLLELKADRSQPHIPTYKSAPPPPSPPSSTINAENPGVTVNPQSKYINSNPDNQTAQGTSPPKHLVRTPIPAPTATIGPLAPPTQPGDPPDCQMVADSAMTGAIPPGGVSSFFPGTTVSQTLISAPLPVSSSTLAPSTACISAAVFPTFSPGILDSAVASTPVDQQAHPISVNQDLMETSSLAAEISRLETEVEPTEFEKIYGTHPQTDSLMDISDSGTLAKEQMLREMVLQSRKRKLLQASSNQQPTSATTPTATSGNALEQLAVNFIADAIARPPPPKRVKITPSPSAMAAWRTRLEQHIKSSKALMAKIQSTQSKKERTKLMTILREKDRCVSGQHILDFAYLK